MLKFSPCFTEKIKKNEIEKRKEGKCCLPAGLPGNNYCFDFQCTNELYARKAILYGIFEQLNLGFQVKLLHDVIFV
jgi:hypothetical protein